MSIDVNNNDKYMQLDECGMIQQTINLRILASKIQNFVMANRLALNC